MTVQQRVSVTISAQNTYGDDMQPNESGYLAVSVSGVSDSTVSLQRRIDGTNWRTVEQYTASTEKVIEDPIPGVDYRLGIATGDYGSDTVVAVLAK